MQADVGSFAGIAPVAIAEFSYEARYTYSRDVVQNDNILRIFPRSDGWQTNPVQRLSITPADYHVEYTDRFGNKVCRSSIVTAHRMLEIRVDGTADLVQRPGLAADLHMTAYSGRRDVDAECLAETSLVSPSALMAVASEAAADAVSVLEVVDAVVRWLHDHLRYERGYTSVASTAQDVLATGFGVCQDFAHAAAGMLRAVGVPARYVSGLMASQSGETHAWIEYYHLTEGWLPADPTRGQVTPFPADLLAFAVGRDYSDVPPVLGSFLSSGEAVLMEVNTSLSILPRDPTGRTAW